MRDLWRAWRRKVRNLMRTAMIDQLQPRQSRHCWMRRLNATAFGALLAIIGMSIAPQAIAGEIESVFAKNDPASKVEIDHSDWDKLLKKYLRKASDGLNRVNYEAFRKDGRKTLIGYLDRLQAVDVTGLNGDEQFAFWVNLYNAKTIEIILEHYPVKSIKDIDISPGLFADGPWKKKVVKVNNVKLSLDDIEHTILRALWRDNRVHYAVNCASVGCPNLALGAYKGVTLNSMLDASARAYINSPRGVRLKDGRITASKIYRWFRKDFGNSEKAILEHIGRYAEPTLAEKIKGATDIYDYEYDWGLNDTKG